MMHDFELAAMLIDKRETIYGCVGLGWRRRQSALMTAGLKVIIMHC
jgi:hypothetical protein